MGDEGVAALFLPPCLRRLDLSVCFDPPCDRPGGDWAGCWRGAAGRVRDEWPRVGPDCWAADRWCWRVPSTAAVNFLRAETNTHMALKTSSGEEKRTLSSSASTAWEYHSSVGVGLRPPPKHRRSGVTRIRRAMGRSWFQASSALAARAVRRRSGSPD